MKKKMLFIYNPHAGKEAMKSKLSEVLECFVAADYEVTVYPTRKKRDAAELVKELGNEYDYIVCSGGDGTLNEITDGLMSLEHRPPCGYIPAGTVNDFASSLKIPKQIKKATEIVVDGEWFPYDIGSLNSDYFNYIAAFGAFTEVAYETPQSTKNLLGRLAYILDGVKRLPSISYYHLKVEHDDVCLEDDFIFGMITNSNSVGGFKGLNGKNVKLDDGLFEVALIKNPKNPVELQSIINSLITRVHDSKYMYTFRTNHLILTCDKEVAWTVDGEYGGSYKKSEIWNHEKAIVYRRGKREK
ncbi:diacylglycerol/lipid kinase family protein [Velocimicrobium porci]|mgnify:CR=1 FL=1|uniref:YegS/Rv2252/BmrU family lipid kinase n=1 Tax=Velocimicrobium porci TaxID=2606634 RepID=A0A6L5XY82_9FIRM|nr:YegS/Rv2252/BmrU family lipid kinase [Velocimicrobium porci]MSS63569.1 YegS/Rv2252/BmrU family lipid kinase [Velocimicrobium porci]